MPGAREARLVASRALQCQHRQSLLHNTHLSARITALSRTGLPSATTIARRPISYTSPRRQNDRTDKTRSSTKDLIDEALGFAEPQSQTQSTTQSRTERAPSTQGSDENSRPLYTPPSESGSSVDDILIESSQGPMLSRYSAGWPERKGDHLQMGSLLGPGSPGGMGILDSLDVNRRTSVTSEMKLPLPLPMRLGPNVGRTVKVNVARNMDVARAFRQLEINCRVNQVKQDAARQRFHERPGLKRKRVRSERWRRTFKEGFKGMIALVKKMKKQGW